MANDLFGKALQIFNAMPEWGQDPVEGKSKTDTSKEKTMALDPMTAALINAGSSVLGSAMQSAPTSSGSNQYVNVNHSGWTVATSGSKADGSQVIPWYVWAIVGFVAIKVLRKKKAN